MTTDTRHEDKPMELYKVDYMFNGFVRVFDRLTLSTSVFNEDGTHRSGPSRLQPYEVIELIMG